MKKVMTKTVVKPAAKKDNGTNPRSTNAPKYQSNANQSPLTAKEKEAIKKQWEMKYKKKAPAGTDFSVSNINNFRNRTGSYSITTGGSKGSTGASGTTTTKNKNK